ncbi:MAG: sulfatase-like hydrolase/transferase, partial [Clostridia bacterium]
KRNLLFLLADQFRHDALGVTSGGLLQTPHLDQLARNGLLYTRAYTPLPVCAPARQALLTGRHPDSFGAYWNYGFLPTPPLMPCDTWPEQLQARGSRGGYVGKWNVSPDAGPADFGFATVMDPTAHDRLLREKYPNLTHTGGWMGCESPIALEDAKTHFLVRQALDFVQAGDSVQPWHLWVDFGMPHLPCRPSAPFATMYDPTRLPPWPGYEDTFINKPFCHKQQSWNWHLEHMPWSEMAQQVARYYGMVSQIDDAIGQLLEGLSQCGQLEDTLIVFTSDHGDLCGNHRMLDKHYVLYDDVVRVPLLLWGSDIPARTLDALVSNCLDLPQTICALFGLTPPVCGHGVPLPFLPAAGREVITASSNGQQFGMFNARMITDGRIKYVWNLTDVDELY